MRLFSQMFKSERQLPKFRKSLCRSRWNFHLDVIVVLPAVRNLGEPPGTVLVAAGQGTQHTWWSPRLQWRAHTASSYQRCWNLCLLPGGIKAWEVYGKKENTLCSRRWMGGWGQKKRGQKGNGKRKRMGIWSSCGVSSDGLLSANSIWIQKVQNGNTRALIIAIWWRSTWVRCRQDSWDCC